MIVINVEGRQHYDDVLRAQSERPVWPPPRRCAQRSFPPQKRATLVAVPIAVDGHTPAASSPNTKEARCSRIFRVPCPLFSSRHVSIGVSRAPPFREGGGGGQELQICSNDSRALTPRTTSLAQGSVRKEKKILKIKEEMKKFTRKLSLHLLHCQRHTTVRRSDVASSNGEELHHTALHHIASLLSLPAPPV